MFIISIRICCKQHKMMRAAYDSYLVDMYSGNPDTWTFQDYISCDVEAYK